MNNTFDIKRFGQVLSLDWSNYVRNFGVSLLVWSLFPILVWICTWVYGFEAELASRELLIFIIMFVATMTAAPKIYSKVNLPREGVAFAMTPATKFEKFLSMVLYCGLLTPLIVFLGQWLTDTILALLPFGGFHGFVSMNLSDAPGQLALLTIVCLLLDASIFMFGNMIFKKRKLGKTFASGLFIAFILTLLLQIQSIQNLVETVLDGIFNSDAAVWIITTLIFLVACVFFIGTFLKIKNQKY